MRLITAAAAAALAFAALPAAAQTTAVPPAVEAPKTIEGLAPELNGVFEQWMKDAHAPGLVWGVVKDGRVVHLHAAGVQDLDTKTKVGPDTLFRIASMSKAFTGAAIAKLESEGKLSLDAPAETYVPELKGWKLPTSDSPKITVRDLLNHTAGFVTDDPWGDRQQPISEADFSAVLKAGVPWSRAPGTAWEYSNFGYALLGRIVSNVSGRPYQRYVAEEIMRPLGMTSTGYDVFASPQARRALGYRWENEAWAREPDMADGVFGAMGGVETTANDYARWIAFLLSAWPARDGADAGPLKRASVRAMGTETVLFGARDRKVEGRTACPVATGYGMGLQVQRDCELGYVLAHGGGYPGYGSFMLLMPDRGVGLFALSNRTYAGPSGPLTDVAGRLVRAGLAPERATPVSPAVARGYADARAIWSAGDVSVARERLAMNFLMDRTVDNWRKTLGELKAQTGACDTGAEPFATGALSANFRWTCEKGAVEGRVLLAPTNPPTIQALNLRIAPK